MPSLSSSSSQISPIPSPSLSVWSAFAISGQLSSTSFTPSPSESKIGVKAGHNAAPFGAEIAGDVKKPVASTIPSRVSPVPPRFVGPEASSQKLFWALTLAFG
jgi:hypothetical protein